MSRARPRSELGLAAGAAFLVACAQGHDHTSEGGRGEGLAGSGGSSISSAVGGGGGSGGGSPGVGGQSAVPRSCTVPEGQLDALPYCPPEPPPPGGFDPVEKWRFWGPTDGTDLHGSPLVANLDDDNGDGVVDLCDVPDVLVQSARAPDDGGSAVIRYFILSGDDGSLKSTIEGDGDLMIATPAIFDLDDDGVPEILAVNYAGHVVALSPDDVLLWESPVEVFDPAGWGGLDPPLEARLRSRFVANSAVTVADLDGDGSPEIVVGMTVLTSDGSLHFEDPTRGAEYGLLFDFAPVRPVVADLDGDGQQEVLFGHVGYRADGTELYRLPVTTSPGHSHVADFFGSGHRQVLIQSAEGLSLVSHTGEILWGPTGPRTGGIYHHGMPTPPANAIVDLWGDGSPEVLITTELASMVYAIQPDGPVELESLARPSPPVLRYMFPGAFDFRGEGPDWITQVQHDVTLFEGAGPAVMGRFDLSIHNGYFFPVVVDVDNDGSADLLLRAGVNSTHQWVSAYEDSQKRSSPARRIWNQWNYTSSSVREDGRLPPPGVQGDNTFRVQSRLACQPFPSPT